MWRCQLQRLAHRSHGHKFACVCTSKRKRDAKLQDALTDRAVAGAAATLLLAEWVPSAAAATDGLVVYDNAEGLGNLKNVFGIGYAMLVAVFAFRLLSRRAKRARSERLAKEADQEGDAVPQKWSDAFVPPDATSQQEQSATPLSALYGAGQAAVLFVVLLTFTSQVSDYFDAKMVPVNPLAAKVTNSVKTIAEGLAYLLTFIFGANALGLLALSVQLALFPSSVTAPEDKEPDPKALPKIGVTDDLYSIRKAFEEVQRQSDKPGK